MNTQLLPFAKKIGFACAIALLSSAACAEEYSMVVPAPVLQRGSAFVLETVIRNVQTGERAVVSEECIIRFETVTAFDCIQIDPQPTGRRVVVRNIPPTGFSGR